MYGADGLSLMLDQSWFSIRMRNTVSMGQAPRQVRGGGVVVVVPVETVVVVVVPAHVLPAGRHSSVIVSMSLRAGSALDLAASRTAHVPILLPFFLVRTLMSTNEPQADCAVVIASFLGWPWPGVPTAFLSAAGPQPAWLRHSSWLT